MNNYIAAIIDKLRKNKTDDIITIDIEKVPRHREYSRDEDDEINYIGDIKFGIIKRIDKPIATIIKLNNWTPPILEISLPESYVNVIIGSVIYPVESTIYRGWYNNALNYKVIAYSDNKYYELFDLLGDEKDGLPIVISSAVDVVFPPEGKETEQQVYNDLLHNIYYNPGTSLLAKHYLIPIQDLFRFITPTIVRELEAQIDLAKLFKLVKRDEPAYIYCQFKGSVFSSACDDFISDILRVPTAECVFDIYNDKNTKPIEELDDFYERVVLLSNENIEMYYGSWEDAYNLTYAEDEEELDAYIEKTYGIKEIYHDGGQAMYFTIIINKETKQCFVTHW